MAKTQVADVLGRLGLTNTTRYRICDTPVYIADPLLVTERSVSEVDGETVTSETCIDLIFLNPDVQKLYCDVSIFQDSPSDHFCLDLKLKIEVPRNYHVVKEMKDPTKRPPIPSNKLGAFNHDLKIELEPKLETIKSIDPEN